MLPALVVLIVTVMGILAPGLSEPVATPLGETTVRHRRLRESAFVMAADLLAAFVVATFRPRNTAAPSSACRTAPRDRDDF